MPFTSLPILARRVAARALGVAMLAAATSSCGSDATAPRAVQVPATLEIVSGDGLSATVGTEVAPLVTRVLDASKTPIAGQLVNFRVTSGNGTVFAGAALTGADGIARERWTLGTSTAEAQTVEARAVDNATGAPLVFGVFHATALPAAPDTLKVVSGAGQTAPAASVLPDSLLVRVVDRYGNPVPGTAVTWTATQPGATLSSATSTTTALGYAWTRLTSGSRPGPYEVRAAVALLAASFPVTVVASAPARLVVLSGEGQTAVAGSFLSVDPSFRLQDEFGNGIPGVSISLVLTGGGSLGATSVLTDSLGTARVRWQTGDVAGPNTLTASVGGLSAAILTVVTVAGPPAHLTRKAGDAQVALPGTTLSTSPSVAVTDAHGNPVQGVHVTFAVSAGGGSITGAEAVTDGSGLASPGSWTLGAARGPNLLVASAGSLSPVTFTATAGERSASIGVTIESPIDLAIVGASVAVRARVTSTVSLSSVRAAVGSSQVSLSLTGGVWVGTLPLVGVARGDTLTLAVTARDAAGAATDAFVRVVRDLPPTLSVSAPLNGTVARPDLGFDVACSDDDAAGCTSIVASVQGTVVASGRTTLAGTVSMAAYEGRLISIDITGTDSRGQSVHLARQVYVESTSALRPLVTVNGLVLDVLGTRALSEDPDSSTFSITEIPTGAVTPIPPSPGSPVRADYGYLTPAGATMAVVTSDYPYGHALDWRNGSLVDLGGINSESSLRVQGNYAVYSSSASSALDLVRRDNVSGTNIVVATGAGNWNNDVAPNGDVVFWKYDANNDYQLWRYRAGAVAQLTATPPRVWNTYPRTDGSTVVFRRHSACCVNQTFSVVVLDAGGETVLTPPASLEPIPDADYAVNAGWVAFTKLDASNLRQVWTRSPTGVLRQVTTFASDSRIDALGTDGGVVFSNMGTHYLASAAGTTRAVTPFGKVIWREGRFLALIGRTAFDLVP